MNYVDGIWNCGCGAMNAAYRIECGKCNKLKQISNSKFLKKMNEQILVNMLIALQIEEPNDMEFGSKVRMLLRKYKETHQ